MQVEFRKKFLKELSKLPNPYQSNIEEFVFDILPNYNSLSEIGKMEKMTGYKDYFKIRFGDFNDDLLFTDIELFNQKMANWLIDYNTIIPHHSLQMKSPVQYLFENHYECHMWWTNPQ
jgi:hypothetical protein